MPLTPLHYPLAYLINRWKRELSLPALVVSSMIPDVESPFIYLITGGLHRRVILHSLFGAATLGTFSSTLLTIFLYPSIVSLLFGLNRKMVKERCRFSGKLVGSCLVGCMSHAFVDSLHHEYNPLLYPFISESFDAFVLLNDWTHATLIVQLVFLTLSILILTQEIRKGAEGFWKRMLVG